MMRQRPTREACDALLALWERGLACAPCERGDALLERNDGAAPARTLGERNARLLQLHAALFGSELELLSRCPSCETVARFTADCESLIERMPAATGVSHRLELEGMTIDFRLPGSADVAAGAGEETDEEFARRVVDRCVLSCSCEGEPVAAVTLPPAVLDALSQRIEALDPGASVSFAVECPQCAARWSAPLDVAQLVWQRVQASAERLLLEVDALARAYGWTEGEVLGLAPARRAAYLQIATT